MLSRANDLFTPSSGSPFRGSDAEERLIDPLPPVLLRQCGVTEQKPEIHRRNNRIDQKFRFCSGQEFARRDSTLYAGQGGRSSGADVALVKLFQDRRVPLALCDQIGDHLSEKAIALGDKVAHPCPQCLLRRSRFRHFEDATKPLMEHGHDKGSLGGPPLIKCWLPDTCSFRDSIHGQVTSGFFFQQPIDGVHDRSMRDRRFAAWPADRDRFGLRLWHTPNLPERSVKINASLEFTV